MRIVSLDLARQNVGSHFQLGPFAEGLNVICGPQGSGKTDIVYLIQRMISGLSDLPKGNAAYPSRAANPHAHAGSVHLANEQVHYRISSSGNPNRPIRFEYRPTIHPSTLSHSEAWVDPIQARTPSWMKIPYHALEAIYLGNGASVSRLRQIALELGLESNVIRRKDDGIEALRAEEQELQGRLRHANFLNHDRAWWVAEKLRVEGKLSQDSQTPKLDSTPWSDIRRMEDRVNGLQNLIERLRRDEEELQTLLRDRQKGLATMLATVQVAKPEAIIAETRRKQLEEIDGRLHNWRQTLREIREQRDRMQQSADELRLSRQLEFGSDSRDPRTTLDALETQILNTRRHLEQVLARCDDAQSTDRYQFQQSLPASLRSMQDGLYEVCQQISRSESHTVAERLQIQIEQLKRCESELAGSLERLIEERGILLKQIAQEYGIPFERLSLAVGDWCQCHEHPHLYSWLLSDRQEQTPQIGSTQEIESLRREISGIENELARVRQRLENTLQECHQVEIQLKEERDRFSKSRDAVSSLTHLERDELRRRLSRASEALALWDQHGEWTRRLNEVQSLIRNRVPQREVQDNRLQLGADQYYRQLTSSQMNYVDNRSPEPMIAEAGWRELPYHSISERPEVDFNGSWNRRDLDSYSSFPVDSWQGSNAYRSSYLHRDWSTQHIVDGFHEGARIHEGPLGELAMRMAMADALAVRLGRFPLIVDDALIGMHGQGLDRAIETLIRFGSKGQQVVLLTTDEEIASRTRAHGGWVCHLAPQREVLREVVPTYESIQSVYRAPVPVREAPSPIQQTMPRDVNQWLHAYANDVDLEAWPTPSIEKRHPVSPIDSSLNNGQIRGRQYFLSERSWIEEVPSIDPMAAGRLRENGIIDVSTFLRTDPRQIASLLRVPGVDGATIHAWQGEASLMCRVPQLRAFDARLLVACGITGPQMLAEMHPGQLLDRVEAFLATDRGQELLRTGNSYELSRITTWIASANRSIHRKGELPTSPVARYSLEENYDDGLHRSYEPLGQEREELRDIADKRSVPLRNAVREPRSSRPLRYATGSESHGELAKRSDRNRDQDSNGSMRGERKRIAREQRRLQRGERPHGIPNGEPSSEVRRSTEPSGPAARVVRMDSSLKPNRSAPNRAKANVAPDPGRNQRFYLDLTSPIVDAPTIGPQLAKRFDEIGVHLVSDLMDRSATEIAEELQLKKYSAEDVAEWQHQASLVCRIPNLRGHDAQLLVAAGYHTPESLIESRATEVLARVSKVVESKEGQRYLRGSKAPDMAEVSDWLDWARHSRPLKVA